MDHKDLQNQLVDYLYDELDADAKAEFERALADDEEIRLEVEAFQQTRQAFGKIEEFEVPSAISGALMEEAARAAPGPAKAVGFWEQLRAGLRAMVAHPAMGAAAVMIAVIGMSFYAYRHGAPPTSQSEGDRLSETLAYRTPAPAAAAEAPQTRAQGEGESTRTAFPKEEAKQLAKVAPNKYAQQVADNKDQAPPAAKVSSQAGGTPSGAIQVKTRDDRLAAAPSASLKRSPRRRSRAYKKSAPAKRAVGSKGDALDDLGNVASERREGYGGRAGTARNVAPQAAKPAPLRAGKKAPAKRAKRGKGKSGGSQSWLLLGRQAAAAGRCSLAFDYFTRALSSDGSLAGTISDSLGRCRSQLGGKGPHVWLASRVQLAERKQVARRKAKAKAKARARAKKRASKKVDTQKAQPSSLK